MMADDAAVTMTAGHATRAILDILDGNPAPVEAAWLLLGYANAWLFEGHGHTIRLSVGPRDESSPEGEDSEARAFALKLFQEWLGEDSTGG
jgi:hypothetical protein